MIAYIILLKTFDELIIDKIFIWLFINLYGYSMTTTIKINQLIKIPTWQVFKATDVIRCEDRVSDMPLYSDDNNLSVEKNIKI